MEIQHNMTQRILVQLGIRRSGNHAISQWLFPMLGNYAYINLDENLGLLNDWGISLGGNTTLLVSFENVNPDAFRSYVKDKEYFLVVRHPLNMLASTWKVYEKKEMSEIKVVEAITRYRQYLRLDSKVIIYDWWVESEEYRRRVAESFGLEFNDSNFRKVWGYGKSSFDNKNYLNRYNQVTDTEFRSLIPEGEMIEDWMRYQNKSI